MMARLIDADVLIKHLEDRRKNWEKQEESYEKAWTLTAIDYFTSLVNKKIAYDVEKVEKELDEYITKIVGRNSALYQTIMRIVREGGVE